MLVLHISSRVHKPLAPTSWLTTYSVDSTRCAQLVKRRAVGKSSLTRLQNFIEAGDVKVNEIKVRPDKLPRILNKFESAQDEQEYLDETECTLDSEEF